MRLGRSHRQPNFVPKFGVLVTAIRIPIPQGSLVERGTFASAASGGRSEQKGVAAVKIL